MDWKRLGRIFDPTQHDLPSDCVEFAQSPQVLQFDDFVRIYFSTRSVDDRNGKYLSHIAFVDMKNDLRTILGVSKEPVLPLGGLGCFDEHGIFPIHVLRHDNVVYGYTCGWSRRVSVSVETSIGLAVSRDEGLTFKRCGSGPILSASTHEPCLVGDGFVKVVSGVFHMWYIFGVGWKRFDPGGATERVYKIGHAVSSDGVRWTRDGRRQLIPDLLGEDECQALPTVVEIDRRTHMFFCFRHVSDFRRNRKRAYRLGHAWSDDLKKWTRDPAPVLEPASGGGWDSDMQCYPHVFRRSGNIYLLYNGNDFGRYGFGLAVKA